MVFTYPFNQTSIENGSVPVEIPDFTRGNWNKVQGYRHAFIKAEKIKNRLSLQIPLTFYKSV